jgi:uncharacterized membrane protein
MNKLIITYLSSLVTLVTIDSIWLGLMSKKFYAPLLGNLLAQKIQITPIVLFYLLYAVGITIFIMQPSIEQSYSSTKLFCLGAFFGTVAYGAYDLTNQATLQNWSTTLTIVDMAWGSILTGTTAVVARKIIDRFI